VIYQKSHEAPSVMVDQFKNIENKQPNKHTSY
jgi:hypothetical protein